MSEFFAPTNTVVEFPSHQQYALEAGLLSAAEATGRALTRSDRCAEAVVHSALAFSLVVGSMVSMGEPYGDILRQQSVISAESAFLERGHIRPNNTGTMTSLGLFQEAPISIMFPERTGDLEFEKGLDGLAISVVNESTLPDGSVRRRVVSSWERDKNSIRDIPEITPPFSTWKSLQDKYTDRLGNRNNRKTPGFQNLEAGYYGVNVLVFQRMYNQKSGEPVITKESTFLSQPENEPCGKSAPIIEQDLMTVTTKGELCDAIAAVAPYIKVPATIVSETGYGAFMTNGADGKANPAVSLDMPFQHDVQGHNSGSAIARHEYMHALFRTLPAEAQQELNTRFTSMTNSMIYGYVNPGYRGNFSGEKFYDISDNEPVWATITESTYLRELGDKNSMNGHPYDAATEMFASAIAVYSTFPQEFIEKYQQLSTQYQKEHKALFDTVIKTLTEVNPDRDALRKLIPGYADIAMVVSGCTVPDTTQ